MKKVLALIVALMMIVSMVPVMAITTSAAGADVPGDWTTWRSAGGYEEPEEGEEPSYAPAPGYEYTDEGFHMTTPDFTNTTVFGTIQTKDTVDIDDGVYLELRVDNFSYGGEDEVPGTTNTGADNWISFHIWDSAKIAPGNTTDYGQGWLSLNRYSAGESAATAVAQSFISSATAGFPIQSQPSIDPQLDGEGREIYTLEVTNDGTNYIISICGVVVSNQTISDHLKALNADGEFYIGVSFNSGVVGGVCEATILKFGTSVDDAETPMGSDSAAPEANPIIIADLADSSTIGEGQPCLIYDANESSWGGKLATQGMTLEAQGDGSFKVLPTEPIGFHMWSIKKTLSYQAQDFPVVAFLVEDPNMVFEGGSLRYSIGKYMSADDTHMIDFSIFGDDNRTYGEDQEWTLVVLDMKTLLTTVDAETGEADDSAYVDGWTDRINSLRFDYSNLSLSTPVDPETDYFNFHWAGIFRSVEDAYAYSDAYVATKGISAPSTEPAETDPVETDPVENGTTEGGDATGEVSTNGNEEATTVDSNNATTDPSTTEGGCASVIGSVAVLLSAAAAAVVLKKRD